MKTLKESILDDENDLIKNDNIPRDNWMDKYSSKNSLWFDKDSPRWKKRWIKLKDGYKTSAFLDIELGDDGLIPDYINFDGPEQLLIDTNAKILNINSKYLKNIENIKIFGNNLSDIHITGDVNVKNMVLNCTNLKVLDASKCQTDHLYLLRSKNLDLFKNHLPKYNNIHITQETKDSIYEYIKKQTGIDLVHVFIEK